MILYLLESDWKGLLVRIYGGAKDRLRLVETGLLALHECEMIALFIHFLMDIKSFIFIQN